MQRLLYTLLAVFCMSAMALAQKTVSGHVSDKGDGSALVGANVVVKGTTTGTATDVDGNFKFQAPASARTLVISYTGYASQEVEIPASGTVNVILATDGNILDAVVVSVGSRSTQRTVTDAAIPIDIIGASDLRSTGQMTFDKALQYRVPSFNTVQTPVNDATSLLDPYEIRNMGPSRTLILINGKRKNLSL